MTTQEADSVIDLVAEIFNELSKSCCEVAICLEYLKQQPATPADDPQTAGAARFDQARQVFAVGAQGLVSKIAVIKGHLTR